MAKNEPTTDRDLASRSGIPLQRHLANLVRELGNRHDALGFERRWLVEQEEVPVGDAFLDMMLLGNGSGDPIRLVVEVKRYVDGDERKPLRLLFLVPEVFGRRPPRDTNEAMVSYFGGEPLFSGLHGPEHRIRTREIPLRPMSSAAEHCLFSERKGTESMDGIARDLLDAVAHLAQCNVGLKSRCLFVPVLVTNAELRVLRLTSADLDTGLIPEGSDAGAEVPWVRYTKTLSQTGSVAGLNVEVPSYKAWADERRRTVFVVQAKHFVKFLMELDGGLPTDG